MAKVCPHCGYCEHCGRACLRGYYPWYPRPYQPYWGTTVTYSNKVSDSSDVTCNHKA